MLIATSKIDQDGCCIHNKNEVIEIKKNIEYLKEKLSRRGTKTSAKDPAISKSTKEKSMNSVQHFKSKHVELEKERKKREGD